LEIDKTDSNEDVPYEGKPLSPELLAILTVYFVQGALGLSRLATSFFMKDELHLAPAEVAALGGLTTLPWVIKPLYGFLSDGFPIFGYKRRSYLILAGLVGSLSWLALGTIVSDTTSAVAAIILGSASVAISDVVADSIVVERSRAGARADGAANQDAMPVLEESLSEDEHGNGIAGDLQSLCWGSSAVGGIMSAYFSGSLLQTVSPRTVFLLTALFPLLVSGVSLLIKEEPTNAKASFSEFTSSVGSQLARLKDSILDPRIYLPVLFVFAWRATPSPDTAMFYFSTNELGFQPEFLGRVSLAASVASLVGVAAYRTWLKDMPVKNLIFWTTLISVPLSLTQLLLVTHYNRQIGIPDTMFALTDTVVLTVLGQIAFMPTLVLAASLCPPGVEGTLFATLMSIYNAAGTVSSELGAGLTSLLGVTDQTFDNLPMLVFLCGMSSLLTLPFINLMDPKQKEKVDHIA
jgi:hypothetical protein